MVAKRGRFLIVLAAGALAALVSFAGGSVGAIISGKSPLSFLAVGAPHLELAAGRPFSTLPITNTMLASWLASVFILIVFLRTARNIQPIPSGMQNFIEYICEVATGFIEEMVGREHERRFFPVVMTVFLFVVVNAWLCLVPGFETVTYHGVPVLRSASTDINVPLMLAVVCVLMVEYWGFTARGLSYVGSFFNVTYLRSSLTSFARRDVRAGAFAFFYGIIFLFVGLLELLGHGVRILSFSFRLFGNMTAGVILTGVAIYIVPLVVPVFFYGLEVLFGLIQALIFAGLTAVFGYAAVSVSEH